MCVTLHRPRRPLAGLLFLGTLSLACATAALDLGQLRGLLHTGCVHFAVLGPCFCNPWTPCLVVTYWEPGWLVETVKQPGTTSLGGIAPGIATAWRTVGITFPNGGGGAGVSPGSGQRNLQYNLCFRRARVNLDFP